MRKKVYIEDLSKRQIRVFKSLGMPTNAESVDLEKGVWLSCDQSYHGSPWHEELGKVSEEQKAILDFIYKIIQLNDEVIKKEKLENAIKEEERLTKHLMELREEIKNASSI